LPASAFDPAWIDAAAVLAGDSPGFVLDYEFHPLIARQFATPRDRLGLLIV
jgi:hypothetical protein